MAAVSIARTAGFDQAISWSEAISCSLSALLTAVWANLSFPLSVSGQSISSLPSMTSWMSYALACRINSNSILITPFTKIGHAVDATQ